MSGEQRPVPLLSALTCALAVLAPQVSCTALSPRSAMSTCFQLGLTSTRLTTLAAPVFMLLLLEGESSPSQALRREPGRGQPPSCPRLCPSRWEQFHPSSAPPCGCGFSSRLSLS